MKKVSIHLYKFIFCVSGAFTFVTDIGARGIRVDFSFEGSIGEWRNLVTREKKTPLVVGGT